MSKSAENDLSRINLTDNADAIRNKVTHRDIACRALHCCAVLCCAVLSFLCRAVSFLSLSLV